MQFVMPCSLAMRTSSGLRSQLHVAHLKPVAAEDVEPWVHVLGKGGGLVFERDCHEAPDPLAPLDGCHELASCEPSASAAIGTQRRRALQNHVGDRRARAAAW